MEDETFKQDEALSGAGEDKLPTSPLRARFLLLPGPIPETWEVKVENGPFVTNNEGLEKLILYMRQTRNAMKPRRANMQAPGRRRKVPRYAR